MLRDWLDTTMELTIDNLDIGLVATRYTVSKRVGLPLGLLLGTKVASIVGLRGYRLPDYYTSTTRVLVGSPVAFHVGSTCLTNTLAILHRE